jgi:hypothetical protein
LVIPFHDLPGRISAFAYYIREGGKAERRYLPAFSTLPKENIYLKAGVAMLDALQQPGPEYDRVYVSLNPLESLRLHIASYQIDSKTLPLVAVMPEADASQLRDLVGPRQLVFCDDKLSPDLLRHARAADGNVKILSFPAEQMWDNYRAFRPNNKGDRGIGEGRHWRTVLEKHLETLSVQEIDIFLTQMRLCGEARDHFVWGCYSQLRERLRVSTTRKTVAWGRQHIVDTGECWEFAGTQRQLCNASMCITEVVHCKFPGRSRVSGRRRPLNELLKLAESECTWPLAVLQRLAGAHGQIEHEARRRLEGVRQDAVVGTIKTVLPSMEVKRISLLRAGPVRTIRPEVEELATVLIPSFLLWFTRRRPRRVLESRSGMKQMRADLHQWMVDNGG